MVYLKFNNRIPIIMSNIIQLHIKSSIRQKLEKKNIEKLKNYYPIRSFPKYIDSILDVSRESFNPTKKIKIYESFKEKILKDYALKQKQFNQNKQKIHDKNLKRQQI